MSAKPPRIGPRMLDALAMVNRGKHTTKHSLAMAVGPNHSNSYGDRIVMRCVKAGLIAFDVTHPKFVQRSIGVPVLTDAGRDVLADAILDDVLAEES